MPPSHQHAHIDQVLHEKVYDEVTKRLVAAYSHVRVGNPLSAGTLCGPLHTQHSVELFTNVSPGSWQGSDVQAVARAVAEGGQILTGGKVVPGPGFFVEPTIIASRHDAKSKSGQCVFL